MKNTWPFFIRVRKAPGASDVAKCRLVLKFGVRKAWGERPLRLIGVQQVLKKSSQPFSSAGSADTESVEAVCTGSASSQQKF